METEGAIFVPLPFAEKGCLFCEQIDAKVTLMTKEERGVIARQLQVLAEDIRRMETRLAEDNPLFVHQDCLKPSKLSLSSALLCLASER